MLKISAVLLAILIVALSVANASPIGTRHLSARQDDLQVLRRLEPESAPVTTNERTGPASLIDVTNAAVSATASTVDAMRATGALPYVQNAAHRGVEKVKTAVHNTKEKLHNGEQKIANHLPFHHKPKDDTGLYEGTGKEPNVT